MREIKTNDLILAGVVAVGAIYFFPKIKALLFPTTTEETANKFSAMRYDASVGAETGNAFLTVKNQDWNLFNKDVATYSFSQGDYDKLNFAQKFLLSTHIIPTSWILG